MYSRVVDGKTLTFRHQGVLFKNSFIMYDTSTQSLWVHTTGECIKGALKGKQLEFIPSMVTTWKRWVEVHPGTTVLPGRQARGMMGDYKLLKSMAQFGLSVGQGRTAKLYPFSILGARPVINDEFDGRKIVVVYDPASATGAAFERGERTFAWKGGSRMADETGKVWELLTGTSGEESLVPVPATAWLVARWRGFYPKGDIFRTRR